MALQRRRDVGGWQFIPPDLLERIALRLGVGDICRMRAVCRDWSSVLCSSQFVANYAAWSNSDDWERWIIVYTDEMLAFVTSCRRWLPVSRRIPRRHEDEYQADCVADGRLVCLSRRSLIDNAVCEAFVYNPVSKVRYDLPKLGVPRWQAWAMETEDNGVDFTVLFLAESQLHIFSSKRSSWDVRDVPPDVFTETSEHEEFSQTATTIGGVAYCVNWDRSAILTYDIRKDRWSRVETPLQRHARHARTLLLVEPQVIKGSRATPMLATGIRKRPPANVLLNDVEDVVIIWELETDTMNWNRVSERRCSLQSYTFAGNEQEVFVIPHTSGQVLRYDFHSNLWELLPSLPSRNCFSMTAFSLEARF